MKTVDTPEILKLPIGINAAGTRRETDSMGEIEVPADRYWGAQTQRSLVHFSIGNDHMPAEVYHAYGYVKKAAAAVNADAGRLPRWKAELICQVCDEVIYSSSPSVRCARCRLFTERRSCPHRSVARPLRHPSHPRAWGWRAVQSELGDGIS